MGQNFWGEIFLGENWVEVTVKMTVKVTVEVTVKMTVKVTVEVTVEMMVEVTVKVTVKVMVEVTEVTRGKYPLSDLECLSRPDSENIAH